jgi:signal transduction histidine kinase
MKFWRHDPNDPGSPSDPNILCVLERSRQPGVAWFGTLGGGLNRLDVATGDIRFFTDRDGLANNVVYGILEDDDGLLWMSTNHGLSRLNPETERFRNYGMEIGLQSLEFNAMAYHKSRSGEMFFGGVNGLTAFYPNQLADNTTPPEVAIVDLKLFNESILTTGAVKLDRPLDEEQEITLDYSQKEVALDFVAFHYADPGKNTFAYKLEGFNDDWVYVGQQRTATFTNLAPGQYDFRVKAANSDGVWNEEGASLRLVVKPPFWATWWFRVLALFGFGGLLYAGYAFRVRQIAERNRVLEVEVENRTAELNESKQRLELTNEQLEQSHTIVEAINQETSFRRLLTKILEEARVIPGVEKATALIRMPDDRFHVRASSGWDADQMQHIRLTRKQAHQRYVEQSDELGKNIFLAKNVADRAGTEEMADFGRVASFLVLRVLVEGDVTAYLVFDNLTDPDAFDQRDVALLERLREHIQSAFIKTTILEDLQGTLDDLRSTQDRLIQSEKMASLGQLTAGIAHEIKNPLNFVNNFSEMTTEIAAELKDELEKRRSSLPEDYVAEVEGLIENLLMNASKVNQHGKRADAIVQNMLEHAKVGEGERSPTDLNELLDEYVTLARHGLEARGGGFEVKVERDYDESVGRVDVVPQDMGRVFMNLLGNAFDALKMSKVEGRKSKVAPAIKVSTLRENGQVEIRITDNGPGIPPEVKSKIFEPFFTTKPTGSGTGLGLSMSYDIVTKGHGGELEVESSEGSGATFIVRLPA